MVVNPTLAPQELAVIAAARAVIIATGDDLDASDVVADRAVALNPFVPVHFFKLLSPVQHNDMISAYTVSP